MKLEPMVRAFMMMEVFNAHRELFYRIEKHWEYRQSWCDYMDEDLEYFKNFLDDVSLDSYVEWMREDGAWETQPEFAPLSGQIQQKNCS